MRRLFVVLTLCLLTTVVSAQESPLVAPGSMSPDGTLVTFKLVPPQVAESFIADVPGTLGLYDTDAGVMTMIGGQPETFACDSNGCSDFVTQGRPVFSPDGAQLAWGEYRDGAAMDVVIYTIETAETVRHEASIPIGFQDSGLRLPELQWGAGGIAALIGTFFPDGTVHFIVAVLDLLTGERHIADVYEFDLNSGAALPPPPALFEWIEREDGTPRLAVASYNGGWRVIDFDTKTITTTSVAPVAEIRLFGEDDPIGEMTYTFDVDALTVDRAITSAGYGDEMGESLLMIAEDVRLQLSHMALDTVIVYAAELATLSVGETLANDELVFGETLLVEPLVPDFRWQLNVEPDGESQPLDLIDFADLL